MNDEKQQKKDKDEERDIKERMSELDGLANVEKLFNEFFGVESNKDALQRP